ncbi:MAG TPA: DUF1439 domain-containing protein [Noviherbaspirillum sp.]|nr:DUF1439 domain-containing protein [Noviherbaspirillum sp.]
MKLRHASFVMLFMAVLLASCASLLGPREMEIPLARLQESIASRFPFNNRFLELLDVRVTNPKVALQPDTNRIVTTMDASIAPPFMNRSWNGNFAVSGQLRFDPARNALVLAEPRVEQFAVNGLDPLYANQISKVGSLLAEQLLKDAPLYTFQPGDLRFSSARFNPTKITTRPNSLVVTFEPAR